MQKVHTCFTITVYFLGCLTRMVVTYRYDALRYQLLELTNFNANTIKTTTHTQLYLCFASVYWTCSYQWRNIRSNKKVTFHNLTTQGRHFKRFWCQTRHPGDYVTCVIQFHRMEVKGTVTANVNLYGPTYFHYNLIQIELTLNLAPWTAMFHFI